VKENDIRPQHIFEEYLRLAEQDTATYFGDAPRTAIPCPACLAEGEMAFTKHGFRYDLCPVCRTLYVSPRPEAAAFSRYYTESASAAYWASTFYKETAEARRIKLWKPKARAVSEILQATPGVQWTVVDVGGGYGLFAEEVRQLVPRAPSVIEPSPHLAEVCRTRNLHVVEKFLEDVVPGDLPDGPKAYVSFELFEHLHDPALFLRHLASLMASGDLFIFTTLSGMGVDIQVLWDKSKSVMPPHHLNFFNPDSARTLLERTGFEVVNATTPGVLDVDILANNAQHISDRFWKTFVETASESERQAWQQLVTQSGRSSHMMIVARKP
jgi:SAM-dependent methyltransferase